MGVVQENTVFSSAFSSVSWSVAVPTVNTGHHRIMARASEGQAWAADYHDYDLLYLKI